MRRKRTATISTPDRFAHRATVFRHRRADRSPHPPTTQRAHPAGHRPYPFYLDLAEWTDDDPAGWGPWAVRCPVSASDASHNKAPLHRKSRMDTRARERLPALPTLIAWVAAQRARTAELLAAAEQTQPGEVFTAADTPLRRAVPKTQTTGRVWPRIPKPEHGATSASKNTAGSGPGPR